MKKLEIPQIPIMQQIVDAYAWVMRIITHSGNGHRDDFLAVCLVLGAKLFGASDERNLPVVIRTPDHTNAQGWHDPEWDVVLDMGGGELDHHQLTPDRENPVCAVTLVLQKAGALDAARLAFPWLKATEVLDCFGPKAQAEEYGTNTAVTEALRSPVEMAMIDLFSRYHEVPLSMRILMARIGQELWLKVQAEYRKEEEFRHLQDNTVTVDIKGSQVRIATGVSPAISRLIPEWEAREGLPPSAVIVSTDERGDGYSLYRVNDAPGWDFSRIGDRPEITFSHKNGFVAKTRIRVEADVLVGLLNMSYIPGES